MNHLKNAYAVCLASVARAFNVSLVLVALICAAQFSFAQFEEDDEFTERPTLSAKAKAVYEENLKKYTNANEVLVLPGLVAKRKEKSVEVLAESTKIAANEAGEYLVIGEFSSHGYEALFWSFAKPSDIQRGLEFIGMRAGTPRDPRQHRFWAKGERVNVYVGTDAGAPLIQELIYDSEAEATLPEDGFIFTGSMDIPNPTGGTERVYVADEYDPRSIIPAYNEPMSVLDVPWQATKGQFYESHVMNEEYPLRPNRLYTLLFEPVNKDDRPSVRELRLEVTEDLDFILTEAGSDSPLNKEHSYDGFLDACKKIIEGEQEPYVTARFADNLPLYKIHAIAKVFMLVDQSGAVRMEPGDEGRLYYQAFLPDPQWRDPENRFTQPWEVHLRKKGGKLTSRAVLHEWKWEEGAVERHITKREYSAPLGKDLRSLIDEEAKKREAENRRQPPAVLLVFVPRDLPYGELLEFLGPALTTHKIVHLYMDDVPAESDGAEPEEKKAKPAEGKVSPEKT